MINSSNRKYKEDSSFFLEFFRTIFPYKWSIMTITLIGMLFSAVSLYFKPSIYESQAIIKVKTENPRRQQMNRLDPLGDLEISTTGEIDQELAILRTFYIHNKAIDKLNLHIQYFVKQNYKTVEIFSNPPIKIKDVTIFDEKIIGKSIILLPVKNGFRIQIKKNISKSIFSYREEIKTKQFKLTVEKESNFNNPIYFKINGNNRNIYEKIIKRNLIVSKFNDHASLIRVKYQDNSPLRATAYVNALIDIYIEQSIKDKSKKNTKILDFIEDQLLSTGEKLRVSETKLETYRIENSVIEPNTQSEALLNRLSDIEVQLSESKIEKKLIENLIEFIKHNENLNSITPTLRELGDQPTIRLIESTQLLQRRANELSMEYTERFPEMVSVRRDIENNKKTILLNIKNLKANIINKERNLYILKKEHEESLKILPTKEKQLIHLQRNYEVNSRMYSYLLEKKSENEMKKVATISDYEIIDRAYSNGIAIKPKKVTNLAINTMFSFVLASLIAYFRSRMRDRLQNIKDIKKLTSLPLYSILPLSSKDDNLDIMEKNPSQLLKSFRQLRTNINFTCEHKKGNIILLTSSIIREGKTDIISNLANIFQMANYKSIVVDLDLYKPKLHENFDIENDRGISTYLSGEESLQSIILDTDSPNLQIIPAGPIKPEASELILSDKLNQLFITLKKRYDYVFIDSSPLSVEADSLYLMQHADINFIIIQEMLTPKSFISDLEDTLNAYQFKNIALLVNSKKNNKKIGY